MTDIACDKMSFVYDRCDFAICEYTHGKCYVLPAKDICVRHRMI